MTEEEAKTKWCPMFRSNETEGAYYSNRNNFDRAGKADGYCIGSACMAWRWDHHQLVHETDDKGVLFRQQHAEPFKPLGFCGLAGKP